MKKAYLMGAIIALSILASGCTPKIDETKTMNSDQQEVSSPDYEAVSEEDSLKVIEEELNDTEVNDFETELNAIDQDINQL